MNTRETLLNTIPKDCIWEEMENLTNTPIQYIIDAMDAYTEKVSIGFAEWVDKNEYFKMAGSKMWWYLKILDEGTENEDLKPVWVAENSLELYKEYLQTLKT